MLFKLLLLFTVVPALELAVLHKAAVLMGLGWTVALILLTGVAGSTLAKWQGLAVLRQTQAEMARGQVPSHGLLEGVLILLGAALLLTPGFLTDLLGLFCLLPWSRRRLRAQLRTRLERWVQSGQVQFTLR
jgi:UPF0716 protein FxsA